MGGAGNWLFYGGLTLVSAVIIGGLLFAITSDEPSVGSSESDGDRSVRGTFAGFEVDAPSGWKRTGVESADLAFVKRLPDDQAAVMTVALRSNAGFPLAQVPDALLESLSERGGRPEPLGSPRLLEVAGHDAVRYDVRYSDGRATVRQTQVAFYRGPDLFLITLVAPKERFGTASPAIDGLIDSWSWRPG